MLLRFLRSTITDIVRSLPFLIAAIMAAGVIHIATTFALAELGTKHPYRRLRTGLPINAVMVLPPITAGSQILPFMMPHMAYSACRFDVRAGPMIIKTTLEEPGWSLSLHSPEENSQVVAGNSNRVTRVELIIIPPGNRFYAHNPEQLFSNEKIPVAKPKSPEGLIVLRAPVRSEAYRQQIEQRLAAMVCAPLGADKPAPIAQRGDGLKRR